MVRHALASKGSRIVSAAEPTKNKQCRAAKCLMRENFSKTGIKFGRGLKLTERPGKAFGAAPEIGKTTVEIRVIGLRVVGTITPALSFEFS